MMKTIVKVLLLGIVLCTAGCGLVATPTPAPTVEPFITPTPVAGETVIAPAEVKSVDISQLPTSIPPLVVKFKKITLYVKNYTLDSVFPAGCEGSAPDCVHAAEGQLYFIITFAPEGLAEGDALPYKEIPAEVSLSSDGGAGVAVSQRSYNAETKNLTLGFEVPAGTSGFSLTWPDNEPLLLGK